MKVGDIVVSPDPKHEGCLWQIDIIKPDFEWPEVPLCRLGLHSIPPARFWSDYPKVIWEWMDDVEGSNEMLVIAHAATAPESSAKRFLRERRVARKRR